MKEVKKGYLAPAVEVKVVAVENGFQLSYGMTEGINDNGHIDF